MSLQEISSRPCCQRCRRPVSHCLCAHISVIDNHTQILILQHPDEAKHPLNTARLAVLGLRHASLLVGETFPDLGDQLALAGDAVLLFPAKVERGAEIPKDGLATEESLCQPATFSPQGASSARGKVQLLIVPDGTWRKARQIVNSNAVLQTLPRLNLHGAEPSEYIVRKAREPHALSTIEAIVHALGILEPGRDFQPLLKPFHVMVEQQIKAMGPKVFQRNYAGR